MIDRLVALMPCQSLEDFDLRRKEADADQLLSAWSSLWHPALLNRTRAVPAWFPASCPPSDPAGYLVMVPSCCEHLLPDAWLAQAEEAGACVVRNLTTREAMVAVALQYLGGVPPSIDTELAADFQALGYCHFQVELLTRKLRYMSNLDESAFQIAVLAAAREAMAGNPGAAREHLHAAFDRLHDARDYYQPTDARLIDLTLIASTTMGASLRGELEGRLPRNLLASASVVADMAVREPETLDRIREALAAGRTALAGGEWKELPLPLLDPEIIASQLVRGLAAYERHLGVRPVVFGRRRFGLTPVLPQILRRLGFSGALHCTLDDGRFPTTHQSRIQWEGIDGTTLEAFGCVPLDAGRAESFLQLAEKLGDAMSLDSTGAIALAHWPGHCSPWYGDLQRISAYGGVLGKFETFADFFDDANLTGYLNHYGPDQYHSPYLRQDVAAGRFDPISRWVRFAERRTKLMLVRSLHLLASLLGGSSAAQASSARPELDVLESAVVDALEEPNDSPPASLEIPIEEILDRGLAAVASALCGVSNSEQRGNLLINPWSFSQRARPAGLTGDSPLPRDVPPMGFSWFDPNVPPSVPPAASKGWFGRRKPKTPPPMAEENLLRNEFCEVHFDPHTGAIRSIFDYENRNPRLAQQIALRTPQGDDPDDEMNYSIMAADEIIARSPDPACGEMACRGRLMTRDGICAAAFQQTTRLFRGSRILEIEIDLATEQQPGANPWDSYYAVRWAWKDESATLRRSVSLANVPTERMQMESPHFVEIGCGAQRTALLCGGLPYHRRIGPRKLDTLLIVRGETARSFRLGIGIDIPNPVSAALGFLAPPLVVRDQAAPPLATGWLFHLDCRNVIATHWEPLSRRDDQRVADGQPAGDGFRVRLLETAGRGVQLGLRCFKPVASAKQRLPGNTSSQALPAHGDRVEISIGPYQWAEVEIFWDEMRPS